MTSYLNTSLNRRTFLSAAAAFALFPAVGRARQATPIPEASPVAQEPGEVAFARGGEVWMMSSTGGNARLFLEMPGTVRRLKWSPSGRYMLARSLEPGSIHHHWLIDVETGDRVEMPQETFWASDRDELMALDGMGTSYWGLATLDLTGSVIERYEATTAQNTFCDVEFERTTMLDLSWLAGYAWSPYESLVWHAGAQRAYITTLCEWSIQLDLATGQSEDLTGMIAQLRGDWQLLLYPGPTYASHRPIVSSISTGDVLAATESSSGIRHSLLPDGGLLGVQTSQLDRATLTGDEHRVYYDRELHLYRWPAGSGEAERLTTIDAYTASLPEIADDGTYALLGTLANPDELNRIARDSDDDEDRYRDGFRIERVDLASGAVETIATDARLPAIRPRDVDVQATPLA